MDSVQPEAKTSLRQHIGCPAVELIDTLPASTYLRTPAKFVEYIGDCANKDAYTAHYHNNIACLPEQGLYRIFDAEVRGKGIITIDGMLVEDNLEGAPLDRVADNLAREPDAEKCIDEPVLYITRFGVKNYGHCLTDIIPRILRFHEILPDVKIALHPEMPAQIIDLLAISGITDSECIKLGDEHVRIKTMYFMSLWNKHPLVHSPVTFSYIDSIKRSVIDNSKVATNTYPPKIFAGRKQDASGRQIINYKEVAQLLSSHDYVEIASGEMSFSEQVKQFSSAKSVVGIAGAAMTNILFCPPDTPVLALAPDSMPALYYWDMAHHAKLHYGIAYFSTGRKPALKNQGNSIFADFEVDLAVLESLINKINR